MSAFGFDASVLSRLALGAGFCLAAGALVWLVERPGHDAPPPAAQAAPGAPRNVPVAIESTYTVTAWTVSVGGVAAPPAHADATTWEGSVRAASGDELLVIGAGAPDAAANRCLRLRIGDAEPRLVWGGGDVTATAALP